MQNISVRRLAGPGFQTFEVVTDRWGLYFEERRRILSSPPPGRYRTWRRLASIRRDSDLAVPQDVLERAGLTLTIHAGVVLLYPEDELGLLQGRFEAHPFAGRAPIDLIVTGAMGGLRAVAGWLAAAGQEGAILPNEADRQ